MQHLGISRFKHQLKRHFQGLSLTFVWLSYLTLFFLHVSFPNYILLFFNMQILCSWITHSGFHSEVIDGLNPKGSINLVAVGIIEILMIQQSAVRCSSLSICRGSSPIMWSSGCVVVCCKSVFKFQHLRYNWKEYIYNNWNLSLINENQLKPIQF